MSQSQLIPSMVALTGGTLLMGGIFWHERRSEMAMQQGRRTFRLTFPAGVTPEAAGSALASLSGLDWRLELAAEVVADEGGIQHLLHLPVAVAESVGYQLGAAIPGLRLDAVEVSATGSVTLARRIIVPREAVLRTDDVVAASRALLSGLGALRAGERVSLRWGLRSAELALASVPEGERSPRQRALDQALRARLGKPGFVVAGLVLVRADSPARAEALTRHVAAVLHSRRGVGRGLVIRRGKVGSGALVPGGGRRWGWLGAGEVVALLAWPLGDLPIEGVRVGAARRVLVPRSVPRTGQVLFDGEDADGSRPVAISPQAALRHSLIVGATGSGKSTLVANWVLSAMDAGVATICVDPKGDLVVDLLDLIPPRHADKVIVIDPSQPGPIPGVNFLQTGGDEHLRADTILGALQSVIGDAWGVRTAEHLATGLRTLSALPQASLMDWPRLYLDAAFRRMAVGHVDDPVVRLAWQAFEGMTVAEQRQQVAAPMARIVSLLSRRSVRAVIAQPHPRLDISRVLASGQTLLVRVPTGELGEAAARVITAVVMHAIWSAVEARSALPPMARRPAALFLDELASLTALPIALEPLFERARGLGCGVAVASQGLARVPDSVRQALLANSGTIIAGRLGHDEATRIARELPGFTAVDLQNLEPFEVTGRVALDAGGAATVTGRTRPLGRRWGLGEDIRRRSAERYGQDPAELDIQLDWQATPDIDPDRIGRQRGVR